MSNLSLALLLAAVALIIVAQSFELPFVSGGSGVLLVVALGYAFVVAKREAKLFLAAMRDQEENRFRHSHQRGIVK